MPRKTRDECTPYSAANPRRSQRQKSVPLSHRDYTPMRTVTPKRQPTKKRERSRSISRGPEWYNYDAAPEAQTFFDLKLGVYAHSLKVGCIRPPTLMQVSLISKNMISMRWKEIDFLVDIVKKMKKAGIEEKLISELEKNIACLEWEMDAVNIRPSDLPPLGDPTITLADISVWCVWFFDFIHENMHRIIDVHSELLMLPDKDQKKLESYIKDARKIMSEFEKNVEDFNLIGESAAAYKNNVKEIRRNCAACE